MCQCVRKNFKFVFIWNLSEKEILSKETIKIPSPQSFHSKDIICSSPYCLPYNSQDISLENLVLDQLIVPKLIIFFIRITSLLDIVL